MKLKIEIDTGGAAFDCGNEPEEIRRILNTFAEQYAQGLPHIMQRLSKLERVNLRDSNGNKCGFVECLPM